MIQGQAKELIFTEHDHKYRDESNLVYTSVTTLLDKYKKKFDNDFWSMYTALKDAGYRLKPYPEEQKIRIGTVMYTLKSLMAQSFYKELQDLTKAQWAVNTTQACIRGNNIHNSIEFGINKSRNDVDGTHNDLITMKIIILLNLVRIYLVLMI